ncbi:replication factor A protein [Trifolium repens]|nr:replication factor A protein [Trifolium repens]
MVLLDSLGDEISINSLVQRLSNFDIPKSPFHFVPISEIVGGSYDTDYLCDVIRELTGGGQEREVTNQNETTTKLNVIALEADGSKLQCTLFENYVDELNEFLGAGDCNNAVVIMQFAKTKNFQEDNQPQRFWELQILDRHLANNSVLSIATSKQTQGMELKSL